MIILLIVILILMCLLIYLVWECLKTAGAILCLLLTLAEPEEDGNG